MTKIEQGRDFPPPSPGSVLKQRAVGRLGISQAALAEALGVSRFTVNQVLGGSGVGRSGGRHVSAAGHVPGTRGTILDEAAGAFAGASARLQPELLKRLDAWRREQPDLPTRPEALRRLAEKALRER